MTLPDRDAVKARLRIEDTVEDDDLDAMMDSALAIITSYIGRPIEATEREWVIEYPGPAWDNRCPTRLYLPLWPVSNADDEEVTITDADDEDVTGFRVNT